MTITYGFFKVRAKSIFVREFARILFESALTPALPGTCARASVRQVKVLA